MRQLVKQDSGEAIPYGHYSDQVKQLLDRHVVGVEIKEPDGVYEVAKMGQQPLENWSKEKTRNETDIIKTRVTRTIEQDLCDDPYAQEAFSRLLRQAIEEAEKLFDHPLKQYLLFHEFEEKVKERQLDDIPPVFSSNRHAQAYFGVLKKILPEAFHTQKAIGAETSHSELDDWIALAFEIDQIVDNAVAENSISPQNIEADIRQKLLPNIFKKCKNTGAGIDQAKKIVEMIVQITRVGLSKH